MVHPSLQPQNNLSPTQIPGSFVSNSLKLPSLAQQLVLPHPVFSQTKMTAPKGNHSQVVWVVQSSLQRQRWCLKGKFNPPELLQHLPRLPAARLRQAKWREQQKYCQIPNNQKRHSLLESHTGLESLKGKNKTQKQPPNPKCLDNLYIWSRMSL